jgi:ribonuclease T2
MRFLGLALLAFFAATGAQAQDYGGFRGRGAGGTPGSFDFYVLSLSWSPSYCAGPGASRDADGQCSPGRGLGFVVHGLWPQYTRGFPSNCGAFPRPLTGDAMKAAGEIMPSAGLARHEWKTHGTCSGLDPVAYFKAVKQARQAVTIPETYRKVTSSQRAAPLEIARQFADANQGLRTDMMTVTCKRGQLEEVRICFDKDLKGFTSCPTVARQGCRGGDVEIDAAR